MTYEEDMVLVSLGKRLLTEASKPTSAPKLRFRAQLVNKIEVLEAKCEGARERRRLEKLGRFDKLNGFPSDNFYKDLYVATAQDDVWGMQEPVYNVHRASRPPPPAGQEVLYYE